MVNSAWIESAFFKGKTIVNYFKKVQGDMKIKMKDLYRWRLNQLKEKMEWKKKDEMQIGHSAFSFVPYTCTFLSLQKK